MASHQEDEEASGEEALAEWIEEARPVVVEEEGVVHQVAWDTEVGRVLAEERASTPAAGTGKPVAEDLVAKLEVAMVEANHGVVTIGITVVEMVAEAVVEAVKAAAAAAP